jgi:hypothetical protein
MQRPRVDSKFISTLLALFVLAAFTPFQNCSQTIKHGQTGSVASTAPQYAGGEGYDGKLYVVRGVCAGVADQVTDAIQVSDGLRSAFFVRERCVDLPPKAKAIDLSVLTLVPNNTNQIIYLGQTFNAQPVKPMLTVLKEDLQSVTVHMTATVGALVAGEQYQLQFTPNVGPGSEMYTTTPTLGSPNSYVVLSLPPEQINLLNTVLTVNTQDELLLNGNVVGYFSPL